MGGGNPDRLAGLAGLVAAAQEIAGEYHRDDLVTHLTRVAERIGPHVPRVLVAGDFKQGKSSLVNALVGADPCPVDDEWSTAMLTEVVVNGDDAGAERLVVGDRSQPLAPQELAAMVADPPPEAGSAWWSARVVVPVRPGALSGVALVDLPGQYGASGVPVVRAALAGVVAVLYVSDAGAELSRNELAGVEAVAATGLSVALVVPKIDFYPAWRKVSDLNRDHLARRGLDVPVFAVSSLLARRAAASGDAELAAEASMGAVTAWMEAVTSAASGDTTAEVVDEVRAALSGVRASLDAIRDGTDEASRERAALEERAERVRMLTDERARWRRVLADGVADIGPDGEHAIRDRLRTVRTDAEAAIGNGVPAGGWTRFSFWLAQRTTADITEAFGEMGGRGATLSARVGEAFEDDEAEAVALAPLRPPALDPSDLIDRTSALDAQEDASQPRRKRVRRSLAHIDGTGLLEGLSLISLNPLSLAAGVAASRRAIKGARAQDVAAQRSAAGDALRHHLEEAEYVAGREWRAAVRKLERDLRDGYEELAARLARSASDALAAARQAADDPGIQERVERDLARIARLDEDAVAMVAVDG